MKTTVYRLEVETAFWKRVKGKARGEGWTVKWVILKLLTLWMAGEIEQLEFPGKGAKS